MYSLLHAADRRALTVCNDLPSELEDASTHKSAKTHTGTAFVTRHFDLLPFDP